MDGDPFGIAAIEGRMGVGRVSVLFKDARFHVALLVTLSKGFIPPDTFEGTAVCKFDYP
ncbi:MAG TPA: hypothetical protein VLC51_09440 [Nitrospira sp.]|nr:hypothetical protein [Nitrospira sp.]